MGSQPKALHQTTSKKDKNRQALKKHMSRRRSPSPDIIDLDAENSQDSDTLRSIDTNVAYSTPARSKGTAVARRVYRDTVVDSDSTAISSSAAASSSSPHASSGSGPPLSSSKLKRSRAGAQEVLFGLFEQKEAKEDERRREELTRQDKLRREQLERDEKVHKEKLQLRDRELLFLENRDKREAQQAAIAVYSTMMGVWRENVKSFIDIGFTREEALEKAGAQPALPVL